MHSVNGAQKILYFVPQGRSEHVFWMRGGGGEFHATNLQLLLCSHSDYLHVVDCADGHVAALEKIERDESVGHFECKAYNLGAGVGCSVLDMVRAFSKAVGRDLPYVIAGRRAGDVPNLTADSQLANNELNWKAVKSLDQMCEDLWRWQSNNPSGYRNK